MDISPRFPILGGWKSNFFIGFNLPSKFQITTDGKDKYKLEGYFGMPFEDLMAKNYSTKIILPEGASEINVKIA